MAKPLYKNLTVQVLTAIVIGASIGYFWPSTGQAMKPLGDGFIRLIKMVVGPIIFLTISCGIASMGDLKKVGRVGGKALIYFEVVTTLALAIGLLVANIVKPGITSDGRAISQTITSTDADTKQVEKFTEQGKKQSFADFVLHTIPENVVGAFAEGDLLQILFFAVLFGVALSSLGSHASGLVEGLESLTEAMFRVVSIIMKVAPFGAMGAMAFVIGRYGLGALVPLAKLMACVYLTMALFIFVGLGLICRMYGFSIWQFLKFIREEILLVLGTSSSESALPRMIEKLELMGCGRGVVGLVIPAGYSFNLDGTSIYLSMALVFIAQAFDAPMSIGSQLYAMAILMLTSKGAAAVTGGGFITLSATLSATAILPEHVDIAQALALLIGVDRFMSEARAITNLIGNGVATVVVSKMEGEFDQSRYDAAMAGHALDTLAPNKISPEIVGDIASNPDAVDPPMGEPQT